LKYGLIFGITSSKDNHLSEKKCAEYMLNLFKALNHCHAQDIIHRDIKPENIMFGSDNEIKFIDFGFAIS
jgi:serine/threonine protein kinase